jgi:hypothetical protein
MRIPGNRAYLIGFIVALTQCGCSSSSSRVSARVSAALNQNAAVAGDLSENPLHWKVITSTIDRSNSTLATLFGNDPAVEYARSHSQQDYPSGSVLSLVTWTQREDPRWFGANIPDRVKSVEFVTIGSGPNQTTSYEEYEGTPLKQMPTPDLALAKERTAYLLSLRAAVMP